MLIGFFETLRAARVPVSVRELLTLLEALQAPLISPSLDEFYHLAKLCLVKDETHVDRFDRAFGLYFKGVVEPVDLRAGIPEAWLRQLQEAELSQERRQQAPHMAWDELMKELAKRLAEQTERHEGGSHWIGTGGTSPFGSGGYNPQGIRIGNAGKGQRKAVKMWEQREFKDYDDEVELGSRQIQIALRRLRRFARQGAATELDLPGTIRSTAANAGWLDLRWVPERHNQVKLLLLMDVGGSMDDHVKSVQELFSAVRTEFKHLEFYYFHNCVYESVWRNNHRRMSERTPTQELMQRYGRDWRLVFIGDATMSPYEILKPGGSVEHHNPEPGADWITRLVHHFERHAWINPEPSGVWDYRQSIQLLRQLMSDRMWPLTLSGLDGAMRALSR